MTRQEKLTDSVVVEGHADLDDSDYTGESSRPKEYSQPPSVTFRHLEGAHHVDSKGHK